MLKGMLASNASKLVAACVCPVAGSVALTVGVPQVRDSVHRATAPRAYALPKTRIRKPKAVDDAPAVAEPIQTAALSAPPCQPSFEPGAPLSAEYRPVTQDETQLANISNLPPVLGGGIPDGGVNLPSIPGVPEPHTWVQMLIGFGLIGGAARYSLRHSDVDLNAVKPDQA